MMHINSDASAGGLPIIIVGAMLAVFGLIFLIAIFALQTPPVSERVSDAEMSDRVAQLLIDADATRGEIHSATYGCAVCHVAGAENGVAPPFVGIADRAAERRPPMPIEIYLYESIINPGAYIVPGYGNAMPQDFAQRMSDAELGDMIAYLLTQVAVQPPAP